MKVSELTGAALDWAVAKCEGRTWIHADNFLAYWQEDGEESGEMHYSNNWAEGGPIIEREKLDVFCSGNVWDASTGDRHPNVIKSGTTPLEAAMRCYVASKLGDEVEIPAELTQGETA